MTVQIACLTCGLPFTPRGSGKPQVRCSEKCRRKAANANYVAGRAPVRAVSCAECGDPVVQLGTGRPRRFCSEKCKQKAGNTRARRALPPLREQSPSERPCAHCGTPFAPKKRDRIYCYASWCGQSAYAERKKAGAGKKIVERIVKCHGCGTDFTAKHPTARWCSKTCANRHWGNIRARQRRTYSSARYTDREIFERDGWVCQICHAPVNREVDRLHPDGATIDHVVPLSLGGTDEPGNVVTAHWRCNHEKGNRVPVTTLVASVVEHYPDLVRAALDASGPAAGRDASAQVDGQSRTT